MRGMQDPRLPHVAVPSAERRGRLAPWLACFLVLVTAGTAAAMKGNPSPSHRIGDVVDSFHGVTVHFNGGMLHTSGRSVAPDGYNIGLRWQCVEFVKRYYFERFGHEMPEPRGNAKDFFDPAIADGAPNPQRGLLQFRNGSPGAPQPEDILVLGTGLLDPYGHVAIVTTVGADSLEVVQQNPGPFVASQRRFSLRHDATGWTVGESRVLGWLRLPPGHHARAPAAARR